MAPLISNFLLGTCALPLFIHSPASILNLACPVLRVADWEQLQFGAQLGKKSMASIRAFTLRFMERCTLLAKGGP